jgi:hypothetical protein
MHAPTFNKWYKKKKNKNKKVTLHMLTHGTMWGCGLTSWVVYIDDNFHDIREGYVSIRSEIWTTNIRSLGFRDIKECVTLWKLILQSLGFRWFCLPLGGPLFMEWLGPRPLFTCRRLGWVSADGWARIYGYACPHAVIPGGRGMFWPWLLRRIIQLLLAPFFLWSLLAVLHHHLR